jgi:ATP-dependent Clp protease protease subunit
MTPLSGSVQILRRSDKSSSRSAIAKGAAFATRWAEAVGPSIMETPERSDEKRDPRDLLFPPSAMPKLYASRTVLLFGEITTALAERTSAQLLALAAESSAPIRMLVHSPGGHVESGDSIHDVIRFIEPEVRMIGTGWVASAAAAVFVAAKPTCRFALPNTRFLLHQPLGGVGGAVSDIEIEARQILAVRERVNRIFARETNQPYEKIVADTQRNFWMNAVQAQEYGLIARIVQRHTEV